MARKKILANAKTRGTKAGNGDDGAGKSERSRMTGKIKVRYGESTNVKQMREDFERNEQRALRSSRTYR